MSAIGLRVGPYEIVSEAVVPEPGSWYRAEHRVPGRRAPEAVFVKLLPPDASGEARTALQREFELLRGLDDPRVPVPVAFYEGTGALTVAAQPTVPLREIVAGRRNGTVKMSPATLLDLLLELVECVQHAHQKGRHHGHLSPDVLGLGPDGRLVVYGYGSGPSTRPDPRWLAPERARGEPVSGATDQWSIGALICGLISGHPPWRGVDPEGEARRGDASAAADAVFSQWPALGRVARKLLEPRGQSRFPSIHPVRQELLALARKAPGVSERRELAAQLFAGRSFDLENEPEEDSDRPQYGAASGSAGNTATGPGPLPESMRSALIDEPYSAELIPGSTSADEAPPPMMFQDEVDTWEGPGPRPTEPAESTEERLPTEIEAPTLSGPRARLAPAVAAAQVELEDSSDLDLDRDVDGATDLVSADLPLPTDVIGPPALGPLVATGTLGAGPLEAAIPQRQPRAFVSPATPQPLPEQTGVTAVPMPGDSQDLMASRPTDDLAPPGAVSVDLLQGPGGSVDFGDLGDGHSVDLSMPSRPRTSLDGPEIGDPSEIVVDSSERKPDPIVRAAPWLVVAMVVVMAFALIWRLAA